MTDQMQSEFGLCGCPGLGGGRDQDSYQKWCNRFVVTPLSEPETPQPILEVRFFRTSRGNEPFRDWLKALEREDRRAIGEDIKTAQFGWPIGMPLIRKLGNGLWEVRTTLRNGIARVMFNVQDARMILLHGFIKKSQKTPQNELDTARKRLKQMEDEE